MSVANVYGGTVLEAFNQFAEFKRTAERMWLALEEVEQMVFNDQAEGLQAKCIAARYLWVEFHRFLRDKDEEGDAQRRQEPLTLQLQLLLDAGAAGFEPAEIRRRWLLMLPKDRKECSESGRIEAQTRPV